MTLEQRISDARYNLFFNLDSDNPEHVDCLLAADALIASANLWESAQSKLHELENGNATEGVVAMARDKLRIAERFVSKRLATVESMLWP